jgi:hypothetical protein
MFGYVTADAQLLTPEQAARYKSCYCGLCRALREQYGQAARLSLTYDMTFLVLLLSSLYEPDEQAGRERCLAHPARPHDWWENPFTSYAAAMNTALAWYKCLDDWHDDRNPARRAEAALLQRQADRARAAYPRACGEIARSLEALGRIEQSDGAPADAAANEFGNLMGGLFVYYPDDRWAETLRRFGFSLGKFIYFLDAACDLEADRRRGRYNPLACLGPEHASGAAFQAHLTLLIGDAAGEFEKLPLLQDLGLLRNILYSGVWAKYNYTFRRTPKEAHP